MNLDDRQDRLVAAAEYVIGTLAAPERVVVERTMARDPSFAREVGWWRDQLLPLDDMIAPVQPAPAVWRRIESSIAATDRGATDRRSSRARIPLLERLGFWRGLAIVATAALVTVSLRGFAPVFLDDGPRYVAVLESQSRDRLAASWILETSGRGRVRLVPVGATPVAADRTLQVWTRDPATKAVRSLGIIPAGRVTELDVSRLPRIEGDQHFAISLEPAGGSPTGQPTGPVLFAGDVVAADPAR